MNFADTPPPPQMSMRVMVIRCGGQEVDTANEQFCQMTDEDTVRRAVRMSIAQAEALHAQHRAEHDDGLLCIHIYGHLLCPNGQRILEERLVWSSTGTDMQNKVRVGGYISAMCGVIEPQPAFLFAR